MQIGLQETGVATEIVEDRRRTLRIPAGDRDLGAALGEDFRDGVPEVRRMLPNR
ncbi:hypothetical protein [Amycolatopsis panacis]|uniref:hypothetical protein n=1 Tax=Amycolatopsis panacis TaxID=2340917 RepID=UPI001F3FF46D|nr:hypothetical protein [Amycolatopsis panacis]